MRHLKFWILSVFVTASIFSAAQQITPSTGNTAGGGYYNGNISIDWSIGETMISTLSGNTILTLGVLQPFANASMGPLPVTGLQFTASRSSSKQVTLQWQTIQEFNNSGFYIERQTGNNTPFTTVGFVTSIAPGGNSFSTLKYEMSDTNTFSGTSYYRLKQVDKDGRFSWSAVRSVKGTGKTDPQLKVWPIPSTGTINFSLTGSNADKFQLFDASGKLIRQSELLPGQTNYINGLTKGIYFLRIPGESGLSSQLIVQ